MRKLLISALAILVVAAVVHSAATQAASWQFAAHGGGGAGMHKMTPTEGMDCHKDNSDCCAKVDCRMLCASLTASLVRQVESAVWHFDPFRAIPTPVMALTHLNVPPPAPPPKTSA